MSFHCFCTTQGDIGRSEGARCSRWINCTHPLVPCVPELGQASVQTEAEGERAGKDGGDENRVPLGHGVIEGGSKLV